MGPTDEQRGLRRLQDGSGGNKERMGIKGD